LGGITVHLRGDDNNVYYYAHLASIKEGIRAGVRVTAGQVIGYAGNTGNASGGAVHLHFEIRPDGGSAINPYPILVQYR
jgi:murein DD-endopeptidase MepM/ murein hydrolase activator NlpD